LEKKKIQFKPLACAISTFFKSYPQHATATTAQTAEQSCRQPKQQQQQVIRVIDVFGQDTEPFCSRRRRYEGSLSSWENEVTVLINNGYLSRQKEASGG